MSFAFHGLSLAWPGAAPLFRQVDLSLRPGDRLAILGGNGSGKTTLGRCLAGRLPCSGRILCDGKPWGDHPRSAQAALVQSVAQQPHLQLSGRGLTVREEIAFGPENLRLPPPEIARRVDEAIALLGLAPLADRDCRHLSGGETQRMVLAGALAMRPRLLILDEPMTDLDADIRTALAAHLRALPWDMAVVVLDIGWHDWMEGLAQSVAVLHGGRLSAPFPAAELPGMALPEEILLPKRLERLRPRPGAENAPTPPPQTAAEAE